MLILMTCLPWYFLNYNKVKNSTFLRTFNSLSSHLSGIAEGKPTTVITHFNLMALQRHKSVLVNLFLANVPSLHSLKTFREYKTKTLVKKNFPLTTILISSNNKHFPVGWDILKKFKWRCDNHIVHMLR